MHKNGVVDFNRLNSMRLIFLMELRRGNEIMWFVAHSPKCLYKPIKISNKYVGLGLSLKYNSRRLFLFLFCVSLALSQITPDFPFPSYKYWGCWITGNYQAYFKIYVRGLKRTAETWKYNDHFHVSIKTCPIVAAI